MNKWAVALIIFVAGALIYMKLSVPQVENNSNVIIVPKEQKEERPALPAEAQNIITVVAPASEEENKVEDPEEARKKEELLKQEQLNAQKELYLKEQFEKSKMDFGKLGQVDTGVIPEVFEEARGFKYTWPCKSAEPKEIVNTIGIIWGNDAPAPNNTGWYKNVSNALQNYAECRAVKENNKYACNGLELLAQHRFVPTKDDKPVYKDNCQEVVSMVLLTLHSLNKGGVCQVIKGVENSRQVCSMLREMRGKALCNQLPRDSYADCMEAFPAQRADCDSVSSEFRNNCLDNYALFRALETDDASACPSGRLNLVCKSHLSKDKDVCNTYKKKLSDVYCSGGGNKSAIKARQFPKEVAPKGPANKKLVISEE